MNEDRKVKPNFNDAQYNHEFNQSNREYENTYGQQSYLPVNYNKNYTDSFYDEDDSSGAGSFLVGALVGGVIGAAAALFLAPKSGSEMRGDFTNQASQLKDKSIEISSVAKEKANELTSVAKEKTGELSKSIQEQSGQLVDKVKSMTSKTSVPMDDGTASSEGEESIDYVDVAKTKVENVLENGEEKVTATVDALKKAVENKVSNKEGKKENNIKDETTGNSNVSYDNSDNLGKDKITNQNYVTDILEKPKK
ncbi:MAG TPA: YtxH domain-containing protein [Sporosarcina psychrophila]|uniref:YtxH domain-containing protein n=1 Tax=Sporosarcina psychrophila TaxID=1476 RepID=A0A921KDU3_SPOPS|nr:YtxH domain-containing protein [Sporosarcina psychrophila]